MALQWLIIYGDRSTFSDADGSWGAAPMWNPQVVVTEHPMVGRRLHCRNDYFIMVNGEVLCVDEVGLFDHLVNVLGFAKFGELGNPTTFLLPDGTELSELGLKLAAGWAGIVKIGRMLPEPRFRALLGEAVKVKGLPRKSGLLPDEPRITLP